jgi:HK97 family phage portal protein
MFESMSFNGVNYIVPTGGLAEMKAKEATRDPIVMMCCMVRGAVFSEPRFVFQKYKNGRPGLISDGPGLQLLAHPWPQATTSDLLARMELDASLYGNSYWVRTPGVANQLSRLDPGRVHILTGDVEDELTGKAFGTTLIGYAVHDKNEHSVAIFTPQEVVHYRPMPDPIHQFRGASWLQSLLPDVQADLDLVDYKHSFLRNAATPNLVVQFTDPVGPDAFNSFKERMESTHTGPQQGFKTLYVGSGVDIKVVGSNFNDLAMNATMSQGETRIAAAAGVPASILGLSEGLKGSALNAGNYAATRRRFTDATIRPLWRACAGALETLIVPPTGQRLWYDDSDVAFLQADMQDAASVRQADAATMQQLVIAGFDPESIVTAITTSDWSNLEHTGLVTIQLQSETYDQAEQLGAQALKTAKKPPPKPVPVAPVPPPNPIMDAHLNPAPADGSDAQPDATPDKGTAK